MFSVTSCVERRRCRCGFSCFKFQTIHYLCFGSKIQFEGSKFNQEQRGRWNHSRFLSTMKIQASDLEATNLTSNNNIFDILACGFISASGECIKRKSIKIADANYLHGERWKRPSQPKSRRGNTDRE